MKFILAVLIFCGSFAWGEKYLKNFTKQIYVVGVGQVKLNYIFPGEPVSRPRSLEIWVKCEGSKKWDPVGKYQMCYLEKYEYDGKSKNFHVKYIDGRVNIQTGETHCDQPGENDLDLSNICKK